MKRFVLIAAVLCFSVLGLVAHAEEAAALKPGDYVAVIGDSITEQKLYSLYIEDYLLMCKPAPELRVSQFGWGGETAPGFASRMANDMLPFKATVATTCYGMNDGHYTTMSAATGKAYADGQKNIVGQMKKAGVRLIVVGSPGVVDADTFHKKPEDAEMYNKTLAALRDIAKQVAADEQVAFANVFDPMLDAMTKAKAKYGKNYDVAGGDGVHPNRNGHLVMAYAFLKALGCKGDIGTITVNLQAGKAEASEGHKVLSCKDGAVEIESSRYPFCFYGDPAKTDSTRGIIEFCPFNQDLNRFNLIVTGAGEGKVKVTWGKEAKEFAAADLAKGINLAAQFLDNPFSAPFQQVEGVIAKQQGVETPLVKSLMHALPEFRKIVPEEAAAMETALLKKEKTLRDASAEAVKPVTHTLKIEAVK
jgi:lysophospholipase L1-like esterase